MLLFALFAAATIGLTNILVHGKILDDDHLGWRTWLKNRLGKYADALECYECTGWWSGLLMGVLLVSFNPLYFVPCAFAGAGLMHLYTILTNYIESKTDFVIGGDEDVQPEENQH